MKFAHDFKNTLQRENFPPRWVEHAIPYGQLKKCLKKVRRELDEFGLDAKTLRELRDSDLSLDPSSLLALRYRLLHDGGGDSLRLRPILTVDVRLRDGVAFDASLSPSSRLILEKIASRQANDSMAALEPQPTGNETAGLIKDGPADGPASYKPRSFSCGTEPFDGSDDQVNCRIEEITVPLTFDTQFFNILQGDVTNLGTLQAEEEQSMTGQILALGQDISHVAHPSRFAKSDLNRWRVIFELYVDAGVFFSTHEQDSGARSSEDALKKLRWFQEEVQKRGVDHEFKLPGSRAALVRFVQVNSTLVQYLRFQEVNQVAIRKILKKFDKRTSLGVAQTFPEAVNSHSLLVGTIARDICAQISTHLVSVVPQISDYLCPICLALAYRTIRLECGHFYCVRCIVKLHRRKVKECPLCRAQVVQKAGTDNIDRKMEKLLKTYFPKETKEKQRVNEIERGIELFGPDYKHDECCVM